MSIFTVRVWNNGNLTLGERGGASEFDMSTELLDGKVDMPETAPEEIQLRIVEALNINIANIAESLEGIHANLRAINQIQALS